MGIVHTPDSAWAQEASKWEAHYTVFGEPKRPYVKRDYPMMLHKAGNPERGGIAILEIVTVDDEDARSLQESRSFRSTPLEAIEAFEQQQEEYARLAAEREYEKKNRLSPRARAEVQAAEDDTSGHLPSVPVTPIAPRAAKAKE